MKFIPTSKFTVEKLKKQAKKIQRTKGGKHTDLLNIVAQQAGYLHWHHVTLCATHTENLGGSSLSAECFYVMHKVRQGQNVLVRTGPETAQTPFIILGVSDDVWLIEPKENAISCLMLHGEVLPLEFEETSSQIKILWTKNIVSITEHALIVFSIEESINKAYLYPSELLEKLAHQITLAKNY